MKYRSILLALFLVFPIALQAAQKPKSSGEVELEAGMVNPGHVDKPAWFKNSFLDLRDDVAEAAEENKRVFLYFYQDGCPYCKKLVEDNFGNREIAEYTQKNFDLIAINMWGDRTVVDLQGKEVTEKQFAEANRVMYTPTIVLLDKKGKQEMRINGYYYPNKFLAALKYVAEGKKTQGGFREYYAKLPQKKSSGKLHIQPSFLQPPYDLRVSARKSGKPLMVMFEQKRCPACDELHLDIMQREEVKKEVEKFDTVLLDMWSKTPVITPAGKKTTASEWAKELNILYGPSRVFFDRSGKEVFRSEAYLRAFHTRFAMAYVETEGYKEQPSFQRWLSDRAAELEAKGIHVDLME